jgi:predicted short-subunit dehydrogenase-like oxidoreductase (DUF2520 family)
MTTPTYGLIGRGRVATHLARYLELEGIPLIHWNRGMDLRPGAALRCADILLLAISDDAIEPFIAANGELRDRPLVHFSGSLTTETAHGFHPLMTFGPEPYDLETYRSMAFVAEKAAPPFDTLFPDLCNTCALIETDLKPLYHALCVLSGNFTTILWSKAMQDFEQRLHLPREVLYPFLERTAANTLRQGSAALTGSLARGERGTVERDLEGLAGDPFREVYLAVATALAEKEVRS